MTKVYKWRAPGEWVGAPQRDGTVLARWKSCRKKSHPRWIGSSDKCAYCRAEKETP
jgi:hypothetical protein